MELLWEHFQELSQGTNPTVTHFTDNVCRVFFVDPANNNMIYQMKTEPVYGEFGGSVFSEKTVAYPLPNTQFFATYYTPTKFLLATAIFDGQLSLLVYNESLEKFQAFQTFIYDMDYEIPKPDIDIFLHTQPEQQKFVKIEVLDFDEIPFAEIQGKAIDGSIEISSESSIRRRCDLTFVYDKELTPDINKIIWLDRKFKLWLGIKDLMTNEIKWYDFGIFVMSNPSIDVEIGSKTMSIKGYDKACFLNGDIAGQLESLARIKARTPLYSAMHEIITTLGREKKTFIDVDSCFSENMEGVRLYNTLNDLKTYDSYFGFYGDLTVKRNGVEVASGYTVDYIDFAIVFDSKQDKDDLITIDGNMIYTTPYDIERSSENTVWDLINDITNLYMTFQSFYDINGYFVFNKTRNMLADGYVWDFTKYDVRVSCRYDTDMENIRNYYKVLGKVSEVDGTQPVVEEEITDPAIPYSTAHVARRPLVIAEDKYYTVEACKERLEYEKFLHTNFAEKSSGECIPLLFLREGSLVKLPAADDEDEPQIHCITGLNLSIKHDGIMTFNGYRVYQ